MAHEVAIKSLTDQKMKLINEKEKVIAHYDKLIMDVCMSIDALAGKTVWAGESPTLYDDERLDYIKSSEEEI